MRVINVLKLYKIFILLVGISQLGCEDYSRNYDILRFPQISIEIDGRDYVTDNYEIKYLGRVINLPDSISTASNDFYRYAIKAYFTQDREERFEATIDVDTKEIPVGTFNDVYDGNGALYDITLAIKNTKSNSDETYITYKLDDEASMQEFIVEGRSESESLIRGEFRAEVQQSESDSTVRIYGEFNDLSYNQD